jgi:hypothetical protein
LDFVSTVLADTRLWGRDLTAIPQLAQIVCSYLLLIDEIGMAAALERCFERKSGAGK